MTVISIVRNVDTNHVTRSDLSWESPAYHTACNTSNTTGATCGTGNVYTSGVHSSCPVFSGVPVAGSLVFCVLFCSSLFVLLSLFFWPLCCPFFFNLRLLITLFQTFPQIFLSIIIFNFVRWRARCPILCQFQHFFYCVTSDIIANCFFLYNCWLLPGKMLESIDI
jgi:hypothetical protein